MSRYVAMEKTRRKLPAERSAQTAPEAVGLTTPAGVSNQAMLSMLESQREQMTARPASGGTPLRDAMRSRFERQFGFPLDDVRIHRDSDKPAKFDAGAYTYGTDIFIGPGQEELLNHEMTHVAQQKMGQVRLTGIEHGVAVNRSPALEHNADTGVVTQTMGTAARPVVQCGYYDDFIDWLSWSEKIKQGDNLDDYEGKVKEALEFFQPQNHLFESVTYAKNGNGKGSARIGSIYFGDSTQNGNVNEDGQSVDLPNLQEILDSLYNSPEVSNEGIENSSEAKPSAWQTYLKNRSPGGRIRLIHKSGPEISFYDHVLRAQTNGKVQERMMEKQDKKIFRHSSRGTAFKTNELNAVKEQSNTSADIFKMLTLLAAYGQKMVNGARDVSDDLVPDAIKRANNFIFAAIKSDPILSKLSINTDDLELDQNYLLSRSSV